MRARVWTVLAAGLLAGVGTAGVATAGPAVVRVSPAASVESRPLAIRVQGLAPHARVTVALRSTDARGYTWASSASFEADGRGALDLSRAPARSGSYLGVWPMGLVVAMRPTRSDPLEEYYWNASKPGTFTVTAAVHGRVVATTTFRRGLSAHPLVEDDETVQTAGFFGSYLAPAGTQRHAAVLVFGGSEGGLKTLLLASQLAAAGFPALALAYFKEPGLPQTLTNVPLEYFENALKWLAAQPQVDPARVAVLGVSRGSEAALLLGVHYPSLVHGVIALVPSSVVNCGIVGGGVLGGCVGPAWTFGGEPLQYTTELDNPDPTDVPAAVIPVEEIHAPLLLACGGVDAIWNSCAFASAIVHRLDAKPGGAAHVLYTYLDAGHPVGGLLPYEPGSWVYDANVPFDEQARERLWPHVLAFVRGLPAS